MRNARRHAATRAGLAPLVLVAVLGLTGIASAEPQDQSAWQAEKCARYAAAWREAVARNGTADVGAAFLERHDAFVASRCQDPRNVCPRTRGEIALANVLTIAAMNAGMASTFLPFGCR